MAMHRQQVLAFNLKLYSPLDQFTKLLGIMNGFADRLDAVEEKSATKRPHEVHEISDSVDDDSYVAYDDSDSDQMDDDPIETDDIMNKLGKCLTF